MKTFRKWVAAFLAVVAAVVAVWPCKMEPVPFELPTPEKFIDTLCPIKGSLASAEKLFADMLHGAEALVFDSDGVMYTGTSNGVLWRWDGSSKPSVVARVGNKSCVAAVIAPDCGRPLGLRLSAQDSLVFVDGSFGLMQLAVTSGEMRTLASAGQPVDKHPVQLLNDLVVSPSGDIYVTESSTRWNHDDLLYDLLEGRASGRVLRYSPHVRETKRFADDLVFPNGVEITHDGGSLLIAETGRARILRIALADSRQRSVFIDNLPGYPDNIRHHPDGGYLIGMTGIRSREAFNMADFLGPYPTVRMLFYKFIPKALMMAAIPQYGLCVHVSESGKVIASWHDSSGRFSPTSHCVVHKEHLYFGSYSSWGIGRFLLNQTPKRTAH